MKIKNKEKQEILETSQELDKITSNLNLEIKNENDYNNAIQILKIVNEQKKVIQEKKDKILKPIQEAINQVKELFHPLEVKFEKIDTQLRQAVKDYILKKKELEEKRIQEITKNIKTKEDLEKALKENQEITLTNNESSYLRTVKKIEIYDVNAIPRKYLIPDLVEIRKAVLSGIEIPGVRIVEEKTVVIKN